MNMICIGMAFGLLGMAADPQLNRGMQGIRGRAGCFLVDYSFTETEAVKEGYTLDRRVYDVNKEKSIKEWIVVDEISPTRVKLQHVLFGTKLDGTTMKGSVMKHTGEDWEYNASYLYDYVGNSTQNVKKLNESPNLWLRRVTSLDDGLRYQCAASWKLDTIPGRETRDMKRSDNQALERSSRLIVYGQNWLEREQNKKIIQKDQSRTPLAKEVGKIGTCVYRMKNAKRRRSLCSLDENFGS